MKIKNVMMLAGLLFMACQSSEKNSEITNEVNIDSNKAVSNAMVKYQCPMDCENGITYTNTGKCPVCEMDLEKL